MVKASVKVSLTSAPVMVVRAMLAMRRREWSSMMLRTSTLLPSARRQWVTSDCQHWLGRSASERFQLERGRLWGCGVMKPRRSRMRQIVEMPGTWSMSGSRCRCSAMVATAGVVAGFCKGLRNRMMRSSTSGATAWGLVWGRREWGVKAAAPSVS